MSSSSKSSRTGHDSSRSSDGSRGKSAHSSKHPANTASYEDEVAVPFHRLDSPDPLDDTQQKPHTISFRATLSSAFVAAPVQLTESSSLSCATSSADSIDHTEASSTWNHHPPAKRPGATRIKTGHDKDGDPNVLFESFVSQRGTKDSEWGGTNSGTSPRPRPNSANSIVNVMKIVTTHTAEATQLIQKHFNICVSGNENSEQEDLRIPFRSMSLSGKASPKQTVEPLITHDSIEIFQEIPFQHSSGSAFGRVASGCSLQSISEQSAAFDPNVNVSRLRSSRGGPSLFLSSSASDVSSSCSGTSTSIKDLIMMAPTSSNTSSISARAQLSIKNKRRQRRERDSKARSSFDAVENSTLSPPLIPRNEPPKDPTLPSVKEESHRLVVTQDVEKPPTFQSHLDNHQTNLPLDDSYDEHGETNVTSTLPVYYKLEDDDPELLMRSKSGRIQQKKKSATSRRHEAIVMPLPPNPSPNSIDGSQSPITVKSLNTSVQSMNSCVSAGSSVIAADREVMEVNRSRLRSKIVDADGSMSIHSSDSASTQAYVALVGGSIPREGASLQVDQFFNCGRVTLDSSCDSTLANKSSSSDESPRYISHSRTASVRRGDYYDTDVLSYSKLSSLEDKHLVVSDCLEDKSRSRPTIPKAEVTHGPGASPSHVRSVEKDVGPVSPPSRFFDSHPFDYLHEKGASKPSVVRRYSTIPADPSLREKIDFFSRNASSSDVSSMSTKSRPKSVATVKGNVHSSSNDIVSDSYATISPDKEWGNLY